MSDQSDRVFLRHAVATLAYRAYRTVENAPANFGATRASPKMRSAVQLMAHMGDLFDWALSMAQGKEKWSDAEPGAWAAEAQRFFAALKKFDDYLASDKPLAVDAKRLFQGPVADALTHVGQLALLRRLAGKPMRGEGYSRAAIEVGRVGMDQAEPGFEFKND